MPRRALLTATEQANLLALPTSEAELVKHFTLSDDVLAVIRQRRRPANRLGFALLLCCLRYPGRYPERGESIPEPTLRFLCGQLELDDADLENYAALLRETGRDNEAIEMELRAKAIRYKHAKENP